MIYKTPPEIGELRDCWITKTKKDYTCYASSYKPSEDRNGYAAHSKEALEEGVEDGFDGSWNPWNPAYTWGLGVPYSQECAKQPLPYLKEIDVKDSIPAKAIYLGEYRWRIL